MSASLKPLTVEEFLAWERSQPLRYEFDGIQPNAMLGGSRALSRAEGAGPEIIVRRRSMGWTEETTSGLGATLNLSEIGADLPVAVIDPQQA